MDRIALFNFLEETLKKKADAAHITDLERYYSPKPLDDQENIYSCLASSIQNGTSSGMDRSIKFNGVNRSFICSKLCGCDYEKVLEKYGNEQELYEQFASYDSGAISRQNRADKKGSNKEKENILKWKTNWEKYARGLYYGAKFLKYNKKVVDKLIALNEEADIDFKEVNKQLKIIYANKETKIPGLGFALCCDWLKECGCTWLVKPDVHIKVVYQVLKSNGETELEKIKDIDVIEYYYNWAKELKVNGYNVTPYQIDKMIWLICTGEFYLDKDESIDRDTIVSEIKKMQETKR